MTNAHRGNDQAFLLKLSDTLRAETSVEAVGNRAIQLMAQQLKADRVYLVTLNPNDDTVVVTHETWRSDMPPLRGSYRSSDFPTAIQEIFQRTIVYSDVRTDARLTELDRLSFAGLDAVGFMAASVRRGSQIMIWAAGVVSSEPRAWTAAEVALFEDAVERTWAAVERAQADEALRRSEERFRALLTASSDVVYQMSADWQQMQYLVGKEFLLDSQTLNNSWLEHYIPAQDQASVQAVIQAAIDTKSPFALEHRVIQADGQIGWTASQAIPLLDEHGQIQVWFGTASNITTRKQAELALRDSEARLQLALGAAELGTFIWHLAEDRTEADARARAHFGLAPDTEATLAESLANIFHPEDGPHYVAAIAQAADPAGTGTLHQEFRIRRLDGERWMSVIATTVFEGSPPVATRITGVLADITERKHREANLAFLAEVSRELEQLTSIDETMNALGAKIAQHLDLSACVFAELYEGAQPGDLTAILSHGWHCPDVPSLLGTYRMAEFMTPELMQLCLAGKAVVIRDVFEDPRTDGEQYAALHIGSFVSMPLVRDGAWRFLLVVYRTAPHDWSPVEIDLTRELTSRIWTQLERERVAEALRQSEKRWRLAIEATELATWEWNLDTNEVYWNEQHFRLFGMEPQPQPLTPEVFINHVHPSERERVGHLLQKAIAERSIYNTEFCARLEDGSTRWMSGYGRIVEERDGKPLRMSGVMFDVDERRRAEDALRTADQRKDEFLAMLAHELRNPMSTLRSGLQILAITDGKDQTSSETIAMMNRQTDHLVRLVDDLLDVSRISQGKIELKKSRVNLVDLVSQAAQAVQGFYQEQGRRLSVELPTAPIYIEGDGARLTQVVTNLLTNGARYTGKNGQVWLSLDQQGGRNVPAAPAYRGNRASPTDRQEAVLRVRDNGIGLTAEQQVTIFELFVQVDNSLARSKGGLGLGLTLVKRLVELHGGQVDAQSEGLGKGSTFHVHLPTLTPAPQPSLSPVKGQPDEIPTQRILVVDDNADAALTLSMLLRLKGYEVHTRTSGQAGLDAAEGLHPAAILLDIGMPGMDGYETCRLLREQSWGRSVVVIALSGYGQEEDRQRTKAAGFDGHLVKPVDLGALLVFLTSLLPTH